jgi:hypothetical protein
MAFDLVSYTYVPTAPRPKSVNARRKITTKQVSLLDKNQHTTPRGVAFNTPRPSVAVTADDDDGGNGSSVRGMF